MEQGTQSILLTGSSGFVGGYIAGHLTLGIPVYSPSHRELDIANPDAVDMFFRRQGPAVVIHAAAYTDNTAAEQQRGNRKGDCWRVNVTGTENLAKSANEYGAYMIYLSTGSVFAGNSENPGPFTEDDPTSPEKSLSWYAWSKAVAEKSVRGAILRMSHPVSRPEIFNIPSQDTVDEPVVQRDYIQNMVHLFDEHILYPLFTDQYFPITYLDDVIIAIKRLLDTKENGIFHIVSVDQTTPHELAQMAIDKARHVKPALATVTFDEFIKTQQHPLRFSKYSAIDGKKTLSRLQLPARTWREIVESLYEIHKGNQSFGE